MLESRVFVNAVKSGDVYADRLSFEATRRCPLKCGHCYHGNAQPVDIGEDTINITLEYLHNIKYIAAHGGEVGMNPLFFEQLLKALIVNKTEFEYFGFVTSGAMGFDKEIYGAPLKHIWKLARPKGKLRLFGRGEGIGIAVSNDEYHDAELRKIGLTREDITRAAKKARRQFAPVKFLIRENENQDKLYNAGRARDLANRPWVKYVSDAPNPCLTFVYEKGKPLKLLSSFNVDAKGNVYGRAEDYESVERNNFGNVHKKPIPDILIEHGFEWN
jgi:hypothetical protein